MLMSPPIRAKHWLSMAATTRVIYGLAHACRAMGCCYVFVCVPLALSLEFTGNQTSPGNELLDAPSPLSQQLPHALCGAGD